MNNINTKILDCASEIISKEGLISFSFTKLSKACNCSKSTLYSEFKSKEDLISGIYERNIQDIIKFQEHTIEIKQHTPIEQLVLFCLYDVIRSYKGNQPADKILMIAALSYIFDFSSRCSQDKLKSALIKLNENFENITRDIGGNKKLSNELRIYARGLVSTTNNSTYFNECIKAELLEVYKGFDSILIANNCFNDFINHVEMSVFIEEYLLNRK
ncbi:TetR/AcrR family transcriptional regulator [Shewanella sp. A14]